MIFFSQDKDFFYGLKTGFSYRKVPFSLGLTEPGQFMNFYKSKKQQQHKKIYKIYKTQGKKKKKAVMLNLYYLVIIILLFIYILINKWKIKRFKKKI